jgi:effector-binding domain-containing protein
MTFGDFGRPLAISLGVALICLACLAVSARAQEQNTAPATPSTPSANAPSTATPPVAVPAIPSAPAIPTPVPTAPNAGESDQGLPGVPSDASTETLDVPSRTTAIFSGQAKWDDGFTAIKDAQIKIKAEVDKAGLTITGSPITVFTQTDDNGFSYEAMLPIAKKPTGKDELSPDVKLGSSPSGKAIKFQHRGPYDDIDSTYDLITAFLDEKGLESRDFFIEEYLTQLTSAEDPSLQVDIYVFIK